MRSSASGAPRCAAAAKTLDGQELALHILHYSERKADYIRDVRELMRSNNLRPFDLARLSG